MKGLVIILMIFLVAFTEIFLAKSPMIGFILYLAFLTAVCFILSKNKELNKFDKFLILLLIIPLIKILQLFISLPSIWNSIISYSILLILSIYYLSWFKIQLKLKGNYLVLPLVLILGLLLGIMGKLFLPIFPALTNFSILLILIVVLSEEIFFRGLLQETSTPIFGTALSIIIPALFYSLSHVSLGIFAFIYFLAFGLISGLIYASTRNLSLSIILGLVANFILFIPL
tara:strand:- start:590 stop:1276 length:687 start_codon:yes stop_codon:yes gene_type:complete